jgi:hypothetical protein
MHEGADLNEIKYRFPLLKENIFWKEVEIRKLMKRNNPKINNIR